jgi:phage recombination protein Bet
MENNLIKSEVSEELLKSFLATLSNQLTDKEKKMFWEVAGAFGLNPFKREIHCVAYGRDENRQFSLITGYEVYLKRADRVGKNEGWKVWTTGTLEETKYHVKRKQKDGTWKEYDTPGWKGDLQAHVEINIKGWKQPFEWAVEWGEYNQKNSMWFDKPRTMIKKVVIGQGFRLAFPDEMGGMPYLSEEVKTEDAEITSIETVIDPVKEAKKKIVAALDKYEGENKQQLFDSCVTASKEGKFDMEFAQAIATQISLEL